MKKVLIAAAAAAVVGFGLAGQVRTQERKPVAAFMRLKLEHSQKVLEGLALEDYPLIAKHSEEMSLLCLDENWMLYQTLDYRHHSAEFQRQANKLTEQAKKKNLDGCALAYMQMTMSCVNCHKYVREVRMASLR